MPTLQVQLMYHNASDGRSIYGLSLLGDAPEGERRQELATGRAYLSAKLVEVYGLGLPNGHCFATQRDSSQLKEKVEAWGSSLFHEPSVCKAAAEAALEAVAP